MADQHADVTQILHRWQTGDDNALDDLLRAIYPDLRRIAARQLRGERAGHTLQPTAIVQRHRAFRGATIENGTGYDFELAVFEARPGANSWGGISIILQTPYPE